MCRPGKKFPMFWLGTTILALFWGGSYLAIGIAVKQTPPFGAAMMRVAVCAVFVFVLWLFRQRRQNSLKQIGGAVLVGAINLGVAWVFLFWAEQTILPSLAALICCAVPIFVRLLSPLITPGDHHPASEWLGIGVGFSGVFLLLWPSWQSPDVGQIWAALAVLAMAACYAFGVVGSRRLSSVLTYADLLFYQSIGALGVLVLVTGLTEGFSPILTWSSEVWFAILYLGIFSTFIAWLIFFWMIKNHGSVKAAVVPYFVPLVSLLLDRWILNALPDTLSLIGGGIILVGVFLTQKADVIQIWFEERTGNYRNKLPNL